MKLNIAEPSEYSSIVEQQKRDEEKIGALFFGKGDELLNTEVMGQQYPIKKTPLTNTVSKFTRTQIEEMMFNNI